MAPIYPKNDWLPDVPVDWAPILLGPGQEANAYAHDGSFEWDTSAMSGTTVDPSSVRRNGESIRFTSRWPERW